MSLENRIKQEIRNIPDFPELGIQFKDITPLFYNQTLCSDIVNAFISNMVSKPDAIVGIESRGFLLGFLMANQLNIPFVMVRKAGKLPYKTICYEYDLEYGKSKIEMHEDSLKVGWRVIIHDDLLATGGTAEATSHLVEQLGASVAGFNFVLSLDFLNGKKKLINHSNNIKCLAHY